MTEKNKGGAPTLYTPEIVAEICDRLCKGEPLEQICRDERMPSSMTIHSWCRGEVNAVPEGVPKAIARAREVGYDAIANMARNVAAGREGSTGDVQRDKLIIETDLKLLAKWHQKKYGDSTTIKGDKDNPLTLTTLIESSLQAAIENKTPQLSVIDLDPLPMGGVDDLV